MEVHGRGKIMNGSLLGIGDAIGTEGAIGRNKEVLNI